MDPFKARAKNGPEFHIQNKWVKFLESKGWHVERMVGNAFQTGIPDLYLAHSRYGTRWVDVKVYGRYTFTKAQKKKWPIWESYGVGIWIIGAKSSKDCTKDHMLEEHEQVLVSGSPNFRDFWKASWDEKIDIDKLLEELDDDSGPTG